MMSCSASRSRDANPTAQRLQRPHRIGHGSVSNPAFDEVDADLASRSTTADGGLVASGLLGAAMWRVSWCSDPSSALRSGLPGLLPVIGGACRIAWHELEVTQRTRTASRYRRLARIGVDKEESRCRLFSDPTVDLFGDQLE